MPCRVNRRRMWTHRILLEASLHQSNTFVTLTYDDANVPVLPSGLLTLRRKDLTDFAKRLRKAYLPQHIRYFNVGEYGEYTQRPHYHLALFNYPQCANTVTRQVGRSACCSSCDSLSRAWGKGGIYQGLLEATSAAYVAGYVTKKLTNKKDPRLEGREAEFAAMSLRPGIGAAFMDEVASTFMEYNLDNQPDVPNRLLHSGRPRPLGRYLTRRLRERLGRSPNAPEETVNAQIEKLRPLYEAARLTAAPQNLTETFKTTITETFLGEYTRLVAKQSITRKKDKL